MVCGFIVILQHICAQQMKHNLSILIRAQSTMCKIKPLLGGISTIVQTKLSS
jgi:hypothetical protein